MRWILGPAFFFSHWFYARWRHGKKATIPMMHLAGFPLQQKIEKACDPEYCNNGLGFKNIIDEIRERFF